MKELLAETAARAARYIENIDKRPVAPKAETIARLDTLGGAVPEGPSAPAEVLALLDDVGSAATVTINGGRYYGFVNGGTLPASLAANWLAGAWDQNACMRVMSPVATRIEDFVREWMLDLLGVPEQSGIGFVTCTTMANFSGLAAARSETLARAGWNVEEDGLFGAPPVRVIVGQEVHVSLLRALTMLGLGRSRVVTVPAARAECAPVNSRGSTIAPSSAFRQATSTPELSIRQRKSALVPAKQEPGSTSTEPSACGPRSRRVLPRCSPASAKPTPGRLTTTSGSTFPTIRGW